MVELGINELKDAVEAQVGGDATFLESVLVRDTFQGQIQWNGMVAVFKIENNPRGARRAYVWIYDLPDGRPGFFAVPQTHKINSPEAAIRAAIMEKARRL